MKVQSIRVDPESEGQRLDVFLASNLPTYSRSYLRRLIEQKHVWVEGRSERPAHPVRAGERIEVHFPPPEPADPQPERIELVILHEDSDVLVLNKPPGLVVHPAPGCPAGTLVNALLFHCKDLSAIGGVVRPGIVHRLDRDTSGVMVITKNDRAHRHVSAQFHDHQVEKTYVAFAAKRPDAPPLPEQGRIESFFGRHPVHRKRFSSKVSRGKQAITGYEVMARYRGKGWEAVKVHALPKTGRTHQIRVHLCDQGYPILGDKLYGGRSMRTFPAWMLPARQALHAYRLCFTHPSGNKQVCFEAPLPADLVKLEQALRDGAAGKIPAPPL